MESNTSAIASIAPGDFDGDAQMDLLLLRKTESNHISAEIHWGISGTNALDKKALILNETLKDQPSIIDANGDMIPDLVGETYTGSRVFFVFSTNRTYHTLEVRNSTSSNSLDPLRVPQSSAFVDFNGDLVPDLCLVSEKDKRIAFEIWTAKNGIFEWNKTIASPAELIVSGRASFYDLNDNQEINIILPGCIDVNCEQSAIFVWGRGNWTRIMDFKDWNFFTESLPLSWLEVPMALRFGDYNLDGFPDAVTVLKSSRNNSYAAFLLLNTPCSSCEGFSRTFQINFDQPLSPESQHPLLCAFYDFMEDGILDIVLTVYTDGEPKLLALEQDFTADAYFLKVMVVSGRCLDNCPNDHQPYGVNQVGPVIRFKTTTSTGAYEIGVCKEDI
ncbi:hypothetical protein C0Q70_19043 [Pomacea canaliculata]|uniref:T-cell immunomodulatory protein n=1 Tax=Pomacea canaliculata TaxID=400727 RepID=A0A2T7NI77_POMCA|nr:hypothetical protein C0Q70_19043 [Pomacea canaliculata]